MNTGKTLFAQLMDFLPSAAPKGRKCMVSI